MEAFVLKRISNISEDPDVLAHLVQEANKQKLFEVEENGGKLGDKRAELTKIKMAASNLFDRIASADCDAMAKSPLTQEKFAEWNQRIALLEREIEVLTAEEGSATKEMIAFDQVRKSLRHVVANFRKLSLPLQREILRRTIHKIEINDKEL